MIRKPRQDSIAIASGQTTSAAIRMGDYVIAGLIAPGALTSTTGTFYACATQNGTFCPIYDSDGNAIIFTLSTNRAVGISGAEADAIAGFPWIKLVLSNPEGADRVLDLCLK